MYYIYGIGVDYKDGEYEVVAQVVDFLNVAKTEQPNPDTPQVAVGTAKGKTVYEAFYNLYHGLDMKLFWGHLQYIVFADNVVDQGKANTVVNSLNRYRETRYQIWIYITDEKLVDVLESTPVLNKSMTASKLAAPINSFKQESYYEPINFREVIINLNDPSHEVMVPFVKLKDNWKLKGKDEDEDHVEFDGMVVANSHEIISILNQDEMGGLRWLNNNTKRSDVTFQMDDAEITVTVGKIKADIKLVEEGPYPKFNIHVKCDAIVSDFSKEITREQVMDAVKKELEKQIRKTFEIGVERGFDAYRFSEVVFRKKNRYFKEIEKNGKIPLNEDSIASVTIDFQKFSAARKEFTQTIGN